MLFREKYSLGFLCILLANVQAQDRGTLAGRIVDETTGDPLFAACVFIQDSRLGAETDHEGYYWISGIPPGNYQIFANRIGYSDVTGMQIRIAAGLTTEMNIKMADDPLYAKEEVTITATRGNALVSEVAASVDIISARTIKMKKPQNLAEVLSNVQGVNIKDYGGIGGIKSVSIRGSSSGQVLVMVDGQRINDAASGQVDFSRISVEGIEKIEVVRGGGSALYGADAIGGVINIITRKESVRNKSSGSLDVMLGSYSSQSAKAEMRRSGEQYAASLSYKVVKTDGNFLYQAPYADTSIEKANNDFMAHDIFTNFQYTMGQKPSEHILDLSYNYYTNDKGSPGSTTQPYAEARTQNRSNRMNLSLKGKLSLFNSYQLQSFINQSTSTYINDELVVAVNDTHKSMARGIELQLTSVFASNQTLIYGAGSRQNKSGGEGSTDVVNQRVEYFAFIQDEYFIHFNRKDVLSSLAIHPALRFDNYSDFGTHVSPKLGMVLNLGSIWRTSIKTNLGYNYKAPSFNDLYWPEDAFAVGNAELMPEHGTDWDLGLRLRYPILNGIAFDISYFRMQLTDLIIWQQGGTQNKWMPQNVSQALNQGLETSLNLKLVPELIDLTVNYTYLDARNDDKDDRNSYGKYLVYRPKNTLNMDLIIRWHDFTGNLSWQYVSFRYVLPANTIWLDPFQVTDLSIGQQIETKNLDLDITFQVKNLFNEFYEFVQYQPIPGREYRLSLGISGKKNE